MRKYFLGQSLILAAGTAFAWKTVFGDFSRFFSAGGELFSFSRCQYPNPLATPCFYGAILFIIALALALHLWQSPKPDMQNRLSWILCFGTLFAWTMTALEFYKYLKPHAGPYTGCGGIPVKNPLYTPCFTGACFYLAACILSLIIVKKVEKQKEPNA